MDLYVSLLADAEGAISGLILHRRVPPAIEVEHVAGLSEVETGAAGFERQHEQSRPMRLILEPRHHAVARRGRGASVQEQNFPAKLRFEVLLEQSAHARILGK